MLRATVQRCVHRHMQLNPFQDFVVVMIPFQDVFVVRAEVRCHKAARSVVHVKPDAYSTLVAHGPEDAGPLRTHEPT